MWVFLVMTLLRRWRRSSVSADSGFSPDRLLACLAVPVLGLFAVVGSLRAVLPHWSLVGFVTVFPLVGADWSAFGQTNPIRLRRRVVLVLGLPLVVAALLGGLWRAGALPSSADPTADLAGWDVVAARLERDGWLERPRTYVFTSHWFESGQLAFALAQRRAGTGRPLPPVLCYSATDARGFADWSRPESWVGWDGLLVTVEPSSTEPQVYDRWFEAIRLVGRIELTRWGRPLRRLRLSLCERQTGPFPFGRGDPQ
jgi:hypothetical protein